MARGETGLLDLDVTGYAFRLEPADLGSTVKDGSSGEIVRIVCAGDATSDGAGPGS